MSACSFQGNWFPVEVIWAFFGLIAAGLLLPVLIAAWIGWRAAPPGRALSGAGRAVGVVLLGYGLIAAVFVLVQSANRARDERARAETAAFLAPVEALVPGQVGTELDPVAWRDWPTARRYAVAGLLAQKLGEREDWTAADWQAVAAYAAMLREALPAGGMSPHYADTLDGLRLQAEHGPADEAGARAACAGVEACVVAVAEAAYRHDARRIASVPETRIDAPAPRLPAAVRAARERQLVRLRERAAGDPHARSSDLGLAWDRLEPGGLSAALAACVEGFPERAAANVYGRICADDLASLLRAHGAERLCPGGRIEAADRELLRRWQARAEADGQDGYLAAQSLAGLQAEWQAACPSLTP